MEMNMATKTAKNKPSKAARKTTAKDPIHTPAKAESPAAKRSTVVPFNPLSSLSNFNTSAPNFGGSFDSMESVMTNYKDQYEKMTGGASASVQESMESCMKSYTTFAKGAEKVMKTIAELAQDSAQRNSEAIKSLMASRTLNEFAEAQNKLAQQNFDEAMSAATKISEMTIKLFSEALEPINGQMTKAMTSAMKKNAA
jgi:phasin family protein